MGKNSRNFPHITILEDNIILKGFIDDMWVIDPAYIVYSPNGEYHFSEKNRCKFTPEYKAYLDRIVGKGNWMYRPHGEHRLCFRHEHGLARFLLMYYNVKKSDK